MTHTFMSTPRKIASDFHSHFPRRRVLARDECTRVLREIGWGVLSVAECEHDTAIPVGVPTAYAHDGERLYLAMVDGRKRRALAQNPHLCLTAADVRSLEQWRSVMVIGSPRWLVTDEERQAAIIAFTAEPRPHGQQLVPNDVKRLAAAELMVLEIDELRGFESSPVSLREPDDEHVTGRAPRTFGPVTQLFAGPAVLRDDAPAAMDAVRRIIRALRAATTETEQTLGVSAAQLFVLREIDKAGAPTIGELARRTATAQSSVSEVVTRLAARGLVARGRSTEDRRRAAITLSAAGRDVLARAPDSVPERMLAAFRRLPTDRQRQLANGLADWIEESGLAHHAATMFFEPVLEDV